jgi:hypothetical protein
LRGQIALPGNIVLSGHTARRGQIALVWPHRIIAVRVARPAKRTAPLGLASATPAPRPLAFLCDTRIPPLTGSGVASPCGLARPLAAKQCVSAHAPWSTRLAGP